MTDAHLFPGTHAKSSGAYLCIFFNALNRALMLARSHLASRLLARREECGYAGDRTYGPELPWFAVLEAS
jgi:hypothetical protein